MASANSTSWMALLSLPAFTSNLVGFEFMFWPWQYLFWPTKTSIPGMSEGRISYISQQIVCDQVLLAETATFVLCGLDCLLSWNSTLFEFLICSNDNWVQLQMLAPFENQRGWKTFESHGLLYCIWNWSEESTLTVSFWYVCSLFPYLLIPMQPELILCLGATCKKSQLVTWTQLCNRLITFTIYHWGWVMLVILISFGLAKTQLILAWQTCQHNLHFVFHWQ